MATAAEGRRGQAASVSVFGLVGQASVNGSTSSMQLLSPSLMGPTYGSRARPTTQEIIAEAFGRRLHGLELLSVKKLNALTATAAKLEAHVASRAAAISRTSVGASEGGGGGGPGLSFGPSSPSSVSASPTAASMAAAKGAPYGGSRSHSVPGDGGDGGGGDAWEPPLLSEAISVALPASAFTGGMGPVLPSPGAGGGGEVDVAVRGAKTARLLALQDRVLRGARGGSGPQAVGGGLLLSPSSQMGLLPVGSRFIPFSALSVSEAGSGAGPTAGGSAEGVWVKLESKVAETAVKLYRLDPLGRRLPSAEGSPPAAPPTPPNSHRVTGDDVEAGLGQLALSGAAGREAAESLSGPGSRRQFARSHEFTTMARFIQSLQEGDEVMLAQQARTLARLNTSAPVSGQPADPSSASISSALPEPPTAAVPSRASTAPVTLPAISPPKRSQPPPQPPPDSSAAGHSTGRDGSAAATTTTSNSATATHGSAQDAAARPQRASSKPFKQLTLELPPELGAGGEGGAGGGGDSARGAAPLSHSPGRSGGSTSAGSRLVTPRRLISPPLPPEIDLSTAPTGQSRPKDLLDGLMKAVEMFVGAGAGGPPGSAPQLGTGGRAAGGGRGAGRGGFGTGLSGGRGRGRGRGADGGSPLGAVGGAMGAVDAAGEDEEESGFPIPPYSGVYGSPERLTDLVRRKAELVVSSNPAGYREEVAAGEVALYREVAGRCRTALARSCRHPPDALVSEELQKRVGNLRFCRPYFVAPREAPPKMPLPLHRPVSACAVARQNTHFAQSAPRESVFLPRAQENESEDMIDTTAIRERQVRKDWNRLVRKAPFRGFVGSDDPGAASGVTGLGHSLDDCLATCLRNKDSLRAVFVYYSCMSSSINDYCFTLGLPEWRTFLVDVGLAGHYPTADGAAASRSATPPPPAAISAAAAAAAAAAATPTNGRAGRGASVTTRGGGAAAAATAAAQPPAPPLAAAAVRTSRAPAAAPSAGRMSAAGGPASSPSKVRQSTAGAAAGGGGGAGGGVSPGAAAGGGGRPSARLTGREADRQAAAAAAAALAAPPPPPPPSNQLADAVFSAVNVEAEKRVVDGKVNLHRSLLRYEWYELLLRLATIRHVKAGEKFGSIAAALEHMWTKEVLPALLPSIVHEPNMWRIVRLYGDPEVNELFVAHMDVITALYSLFSAASKNKLMHMADWIGLLNTCAIIGDATGVTLHSAKLAYVRSLAVVVDECASWGRAVCLTRCGFMEALARLAEELAPPPLEEVAEAMREAGIHGRELRAALEAPWGYYYNELPVDLLVARRQAAAEAAAARSTTTGDDSALPSLQNSTTRLDFSAPTALSGGGGAGGRNPAAAAAAAAKGSRPGSVGGAGGGSGPTPAGLAALSAAITGPTATSPPSSWNSLPKLSYRLEALLELMTARLREHWECDDNTSLAERLATTAAGLQAAA